jgi:hypothetical protein
MKISQKNKTLQTMFTGQEDAERFKQIKWEGRKIGSVLLALR